MYLRFWGVRGSTPTPQRGNLRYGGNTSCVELRTREGIFVFDCGTGLRLLGHSLRKEFGKRPIKARVFVSHYHWDHIQGIPFFTPLYGRQNHFDFHSFKSTETSVRQALQDQMVNPYFPVDMRAMLAKRHFHEIGEEKRIYDGLTIISKRLYHPQGCMGFRVEHNGKVIVYATDNEPGNSKGDQNVRALAQGKSGEKIIAAIIALSRSLNLSVVAEGASQARESRRLRDLGCRLVQGFYFSQAVPFDAAMAMARDPDAFFAEKFAALETPQFADQSAPENARSSVVPMKLTARVGSRLGKWLGDR